MKYTIIILALLFFSCGNQSTSSEDMRANVMKIHDDSMLKMGEIRQAVFKLEELAESNADSTEILRIVKLLENADEGMMLWMQEYKEPEMEEELKAFYEEEMVKIQEVADNIYKSLENAQKYIN